MPSIPPRRLVAQLNPDELESRGQGRSKSKGVQNLTQCEIVRTTLENEIFTGRLAPGTPLDEEAIAQRFNVSRTPVREAMLQLTQTGLVEKKSRGRAIVAPLDVKRLIQSFEALSELEGVCARFAARRISDDERDSLTEVHDKSERALAAGAEEEYGRLSRTFHGQIWRATHNEVLIDITRKLQVRLIPYRMFQLRSKGRPQANLEDHKDILEAIIAGDAGKAEALMRGHVTVQGDVLAEYISYT